MGSMRDDLDQFKLFLFNFSVEQLRESTESIQNINSFLKFSIPKI